MKTVEEVLNDLIPNRPWKIGGRTDQSIITVAAKYAEQFKPQWISVEDRLPGIQGDYIVIDTISNKPIIMGYIFINGKWSWQMWDSIITHWMPLPESPQK